MNSLKPPADKKVSPRHEPRLPPGQILTEKWPVLHYGNVPRVDLTQWDFRLDGLVEQPIRWSWDEFRAHPERFVFTGSPEQYYAAEYGTVRDFRQVVPDAIRGTSAPS